MKKISHFVYLLFFIVCACSKIDDGVVSTGIRSNGVKFTDTVKVPITDLGTGTYFGFTGGLYPGGINNPTLQYKKDLKNFATA
ncbi:MAG TPA: hypothetical protein VEV62_10645, partial [Parafilimonas sp.]|nr:hypothetical protein [Parafilimonas sp.]